MDLNARRDQHVYIVDDDDSVRTALVRGLGLLGYDVHQFASAPLLLEAGSLFRPAVIVIDMQMPRMNGIELQQGLIDKGWHAPVIFISGQSTVPQSITAMKQGAVDFLSKPFDLDRLAAIIDAAIQEDARRLSARARRLACQRLLDELKPRELEAFFLLAKGYSYQELMRVLHISLPTAKQYRAAVMRKLKFDSLAELIRFHQDLTEGAG